MSRDCKIVVAGIVVVAVGIAVMLVIAGTPPAEPSYEEEKFRNEAKQAVVDAKKAVEIYNDPRSSQESWLTARSRFGSFVEFTKPPKTDEAKKFMALAEKVHDTIESLNLWWGTRLSYQRKNAIADLLQRLESATPK